MGGNAFRSTLTSGAFPRLPPAVYHGLKTRIWPILEELYVHVAVPHEAPEKKDYGDLDFIVGLPRRPATRQSPTNTETVASAESPPESKVQVNVPHDIVAAAIGALHVNPMDGNRTSNLAVPIPKGEWAQYGHEQEEMHVRAESENNEIFYQVDVNVCESKGEWERRASFNSYGDLNIILGLIIKNAGLHFSSYGLKLPDPPNPPLLLSDSFDHILDFFGWSKSEWQEGFKTNMACYSWAAKTKYFDPRHFKTSGPGIHKKKPDRTMYAGFTEWAASLGPESDENGNPMMRPQTGDAREDALDFFGKRTEFEEKKAERRRKETMKVLFSGSHVRDWTGLGNYWLGVKRIMDVVRERCGGEEGVMRLLDVEGEKGLQTLVLRVQDELQIYPLVKDAGETEEQKLIQDVDALKL